MAKLHEDYAKVAHPEWLDEVAKSREGDRDYHPADEVTPIFLDHCAVKQTENYGEKPYSVEHCLELFHIECPDGKIRKLFLVEQKYNAVLLTDDYAEAIAVWELVKDDFWKERWRLNGHVYDFGDSMPPEIAELRRKHDIR